MDLKRKTVEEANGEIVPRPSAPLLDYSAEDDRASSDLDVSPLSMSQTDDYIRMIDDLMKGFDEFSSSSRLSRVVDLPTSSERSKVEECLPRVEACIEDLRAQPMMSLKKSLMMAVEWTLPDTISSIHDVHEPPQIRKQIRRYVGKPVKSGDAAENRKTATKIPQAEWQIEVKNAAKTGKESKIPSGKNLKPTAEVVATGKHVPCEKSEMRLPAKLFKNQADRKKLAETLHLYNPQFCLSTGEVDFAEQKLVPYAENTATYTLERLRDSVYFTPDQDDFKRKLESLRRHPRDPVELLGERRERKLRQHLAKVAPQISTEQLKSTDDHTLEAASISDQRGDSKAYDAEGRTSAYADHQAIDNDDVVGDHLQQQQNVSGPTTGSVEPSRTALVRPTQLDFNEDTLSDYSQWSEDEDETTASANRFTGLADSFKMRTELEKELTALEGYLTLAVSMKRTPVFDIVNRTTIDHLVVATQSPYEMLKPKTVVVPPTSYVTHVCSCTTTKTRTLMREHMQQKVKKMTKEESTTKLSRKFSITEVGELPPIEMQTEDTPVGIRKRQLEKKTDERDMLKLVAIMDKLVDLNLQQSATFDFSAYEPVISQIDPTSYGTFTPLYRLDGPTHVIQLKWSPWNNRVIISCHTSVLSIEASHRSILIISSIMLARRPLFKITLPRVATCMDTHPDSRHLICVGFTDGTITLFDYRSQACGQCRLADVETNTSCHDGSVNSVKFHLTDPDQIFSCGNDGQVGRWLMKRKLSFKPYFNIVDPLSWEYKSEAPLFRRCRATCLELNTLNRDTYVVGTSTGHIICLSASSVCRPSFIAHAHQSPVSQIAWNPLHVHVLLTMGVGYTVKIWNYAEKAHLVTYTLQWTVGQIGWSPVSSTRFFVSNICGMIFVYDLYQNPTKPMCQLSTRDIQKMSCFALQPDNSCIAVGDIDGFVCIYKLSPNIAKFSTKDDVTIEITREREMKKMNEVMKGMLDNPMHGINMTTRRRNQETEKT